MGTKVEIVRVKLDSAHMPFSGQQLSLLHKRPPRPIALCFRADGDLVNQQGSRRKGKWILRAFDQLADDTANSFPILLSDKNVNRQIGQHCLKKGAGKIIRIRHFE